MSPDGTKVFVTGYRPAPRGTDYATIAYNAASGAQLWAKRYNGPGGWGDYASSVAVGPHGDMVFVTGASGGDYATVAYDAASGAQLWVQRYDDPIHSYDQAVAVAASPDGSAVYVTGTTRDSDYTTVAYDAATGAQRWVQSYNGSANSFDDARAMTVSPDGHRVFVTGRSFDGQYDDYATVAYDAATGAKLWIQRYNGPSNGEDTANSVAVSPAGNTVFVTGYSVGANDAEDYATVAYNAATGAQLWIQRHNGPTSTSNAGATSVAVSPSGNTVFVTGYTDETSATDYATLAYNASTGAQLWAKRYNGPGNSYDTAVSVAVSPTRDTVYVTGSSTSVTTGSDYATIAYNAATGARQWLRRYNGPGNSDDSAASVAVSPTGDRMFVTGSSTGVTTGVDYATIAYSG